MPVLPLEPCVWPGNLLEEAAPPIKTDSRWWVLHTRPRTEKAVMRNLLFNNVACFLPSYEKTKQYERRRTVSRLPLFPGYVFLNGNEEHRTLALQTNRVAACLEVPDIRQEQLWFDLKRLFSCMQSGLPLLPEERLCPGTLVEITSGALVGVRGTIIRRLNSKRVFVAVEFLQRGASIDVENLMLSPV